jgi:penicillin-binding protein A
VNSQITRVATLALILLIALIVGTTYWQVWASSGLAAKQDNAIQRVAQFTIKRGKIYAPHGQVIYATNVRRKVKGETFYFRKYPDDATLAQTLGYSTQERSRTGLEQSLNDYLTGTNTNLNTVLRTSLDRLKGVTVTGNNVFLTVNTHAQQVAQNALGTQCGAVVALEPSTGKVLVLASNPTFNLNLADTSHFLPAVNKIKANCHPASPLVNRGTASLFPPGSSFKVVTAAAALDTGIYTPQSQFVDPGYCIEYGQKVRNAGDPESPEQFGSLTFFQALEHSVNSVFCKVGIRLGATRILDYAKRFGFYSLPPLETPSSERTPSGLYDKGKLFFPSNNSQVDAGRLAFGQERMIVTPLQMAMVAAGVANKGVVMRPYVVDRIEQPSGSLVTRTSPKVLSRAIKPETAHELNLMMQAVVTGGTGTQAAIPGVPVAGKTGTAETGNSGINTTWFIAFAPADHPKVAARPPLRSRRPSSKPS